MSSLHIFDPFCGDIRIEKYEDRFYKDEYFIVFDGRHEEIRLKIGEYLEDVQGLINRLQDKLDEYTERMAKT